MARLDLITIGELLYVLKAPYPGLLEQTPSLSCHASCSEANVAIGVTRLGWSSGLVTKVVNNFIGRFAVSSLRGSAVDVSNIIWTDVGRMGLLFQDAGIPPRPSNSVNDREHSAFVRLEPDAVNWSQALTADRLFLTGITPDLGELPRQLVLRAVKEVDNTKTQTIFDCNYRSRLWSIDEAREFIMPFLRHVDILFIKLEEARSILGLEGDPVNITQQLRADHGIDIVVLSLSSDGAVANDGIAAHTPAIEAHVVNRFGMGDAFIACFLYGYAIGGLQTGLNHGHALAALKATYFNENFALVSQADVARLLDGIQDGSLPDRGAQIIR